MCGGGEVLNEHFGCEGDGEGGVFGRVNALGIGVDDFLDAGDLDGWVSLSALRVAGRGDDGRDRRSEE